MELSVLLSRNAQKFMEGARKDTAREDNQMFLILINEAKIILILENILNCWNMSIISKNYIYIM